MITLNPQYIKDSTGNNLVVLLQKEFDKIIEQLEDFEDIRLYKEAKKGKQEFVDAQKAFQEIEDKRSNNDV